MGSGAWLLALARLGANTQGQSGAGPFFFLSLFFCRAGTGKIEQTHSPDAFDLCNAMLGDSGQR